MTFIKICSRKNFKILTDLYILKNAGIIAVLPEKTSNLPDAENQNENLQIDRIASRSVVPTDNDFIQQKIEFQFETPNENFQSAEVLDGQIFENQNAFENKENINFETAQAQFEIPVSSNDFEYKLYAPGKSII